MPLERIDIFSGDEHPSKGLTKGLPEDFSFGGKAVHGCRLSGQYQPGRRITPPTTPASGDGLGVSWSPTGRTFTAGFTAAPYFKAYSFDGDTFNTLTISLSLSNSVDSVDWSPNGHFFSVCSGWSPYIHVFAFTEPNVFAAVTTPPSAPPNRALNASWSPDGRSLAVSHYDSPYISVYKLAFNTSNLALSTFTKISNPAILPTGISSACSWSPDGKYLAVGHLVSPYLTVYKYNGNTLVKIDGPPALAPVSQVEGLAWSPDGKILTICTSPDVPTYGAGLRFYHFEDGEFQDTYIGFEGSFNPSRAVDCEWSLDGRFLAVGHIDTPYLSVYTFDGESFTQMRTPDTVPGGYVTGVSWSPDSEYLATSHVGTPRLSIYKALPGNIVGGNMVELEPLSNLR